MAHSDRGPNFREARVNSPALAWLTQQGYVVGDALPWEDGVGQSQTIFPRGYRGDPCELGIGTFSLRKADGVSGGDPKIVQEFMVRIDPHRNRTELDAALALDEDLRGIGVTPEYYPPITGEGESLQGHIDRANSILSNSLYVIGKLAERALSK